MRQISRRGFIYGSAALSVATRPWFAQAKPNHDSDLLLVGTQTGETSKGIYAYTFDSVTGDLKQIGLAAEANNPTFLALSPKGDLVFVANERDQYEGKDSGAVSSYTLDRKAAKLIKINEVASSVVVPATSPSITPDVPSSPQTTAEAAPHRSPSATTAAQVCIVSFEQFTGHGPDHDRQLAPHAHRVTVSPDNRFLLVNDLGLDEVHIYHLDADTAKLTLSDPPAWKSAPEPAPARFSFIPAASGPTASPKWPRPSMSSAGTASAAPSKPRRSSL